MNFSAFTPFIERLGWVLLHFLWQGTAVAVLLGIVLRLTRRSAPRVRYLASGMALLLMMACVTGTLFRQGFRPVAESSPVETVWSETRVPVSPHALIPRVENSVEVPPAVMPAEPVSSIGALEQTVRTTPKAPELTGWRERLRPWLPRAVGIWALGVVFFSLRLLNGWRAARRWRGSGTTAIPGDWPRRFQSLCARLGLTRPVRLLSSATLAVPVVIGWLKPVVLVPAGLFTGMGAAQLEALLAHELAHVRRHDYLVNLLQSVLETLFFYHPAVWWVSAQLRSEREHCCDDVASAHCGGPLSYARALTALEEMRGPAPVLAMSSAGGSLLRRVRRLAGVTERAPSLAWPLGLIVLGTTALALPFTLLAAPPEPAFTAPRSAHTGTDKHTAYCVHDGMETHFILAANTTFNSATSNGANSKTRTWHDQGTLTFDNGKSLKFSRTSGNPETLLLTAGGGAGEPETRSFDLTKGRVFLIAPDRAPRQLTLKADPVTTPESMEQLFTAIAQIPDPVIRGVRVQDYPSVPNDAGALPEIWEPEPEYPGMWRRKAGVFEMPLYGTNPEAWLKYPADSPSFYIETTDTVWKIPGDPMEVLHLRNLLQSKLAEESPVDALYRIRLMVLRGDDRLRAAAYDLMKDPAGPKWRFDFDELISSLEEVVKRYPDAPSTPAGIQTLAKVRAAAETAKTTWEKSRVVLPEEAYSQGKKLDDRGIIWSDADASGLSIGHSISTRQSLKDGDQLEFTVCLRNTGTSPVKISCTNRLDEGLRMWVVDEKGKRYEVRITMFTTLLMASHVRLAPGEMLEWKTPSVIIVESADGNLPGGSTPGSAARLALPPGVYQFHIEGRVGAFEQRGPGGSVTVPAAGEWTGTLNAKPVTMSIAGKTAWIPTKRFLEEFSVPPPPVPGGEAPADQLAGVPKKTFHHSDGSRTESFRRPDGKEVQEFLYAHDGTLVLKRLFITDSQGRPRQAYVFDANRHPMGSIQFGYDRDKDQLVEERQFDEKGRLVRRVFYSGPGASGSAGLMKTITYDPDDPAKKPVMATLELQPFLPEDQGQSGTEDGGSRPAPASPLLLTGRMRFRLGQNLEAMEALRKAAAQDPAQAPQAAGEIERVERAGEAIQRAGEQAGRPKRFFQRTDGSGSVSDPAPAFMEKDPGTGEIRIGFEIPLRDWMKRGGKDGASGSRGEAAKEGGR